MRATSILFVALLIWPSSAIGLSGTDWLHNLQPDQRNVYIAGAVDGWGVGGTEQYSRLYQCVSTRGITDQEIHALVDKYLRDNPAQVPMSLILLVRNALDAVCK